MKYLIVLCDGMSDRPVPQLGGKTPLEAAFTPNMDFIASHGITGTVKTIPEAFPPGSDVANLSVMGYDPAVCYTGRSPLEAVSMGIKLDDRDTAFRLNLVTLTNYIDSGDCIMDDYCADEISTAESKILIDYLKKELSCTDMEFFAGLSYRHCLIWRNGPIEFEPSPLTPPHDIIGRHVLEYLPRGSNGGRLFKLVKKAGELLKNHPVNMKRTAKGLKPANAIWLWGEGRKPAIESFNDKYGITGAVISAVDLVKGIGICAGLKTVEVEGATGNIDTNFEGKALAALSELDMGTDFVYLHIEAPDECGHRKETENKVKAIEKIDAMVLAPILKALKSFKAYSIMVLPDHSTPLELRTHTSEPVPFALYRKGMQKNHLSAGCYTEKEAQESDLYIDRGFKLMNFFIKGTGWTADRFLEEAERT